MYDIKLFHSYIYEIWQFTPNFVDKSVVGAPSKPSSHSNVFLNGKIKFPPILILHL